MPWPKDLVTNQTLLHIIWMPRKSGSRDLSVKVNSFAQKWDVIMKGERFSHMALRNRFWRQVTLTVASSLYLRGASMLGNVKSRSLAKSHRFYDRMDTWQMVWGCVRRSYQLGGLIQLTLRLAIVILSPMTCFSGSYHWYDQCSDPSEPQSMWSLRDKFWNSKKLVREARFVPGPLCLSSISLFLP